MPFGVLKLDAIRSTYSIIPGDNAENALRGAEIVHHERQVLANRETTRRMPFGVLK